MDLFSTTACFGKNVKVRGEVVACTRRKRALFNRAMETIHTRGASSLSRADAVNRPTTATYSLGAPRLGHKRLVDPPVSYKFLEFEYNLFLIIIHPSPKTFIILVRHSSRSSSSRGHFYRPMVKGREREGKKPQRQKSAPPCYRCHVVFPGWTRNRPRRTRVFSSAAADSASTFCKSSPRRSGSLTSSSEWKTGNGARWR